MNKDRLIGAGTLIVCVAVAIVFYPLFFCLGYGSLAISIVVFAAVLLLLCIVGWIGWTMATTPPSAPVETSAGGKAGVPVGDLRTTREEAYSRYPY